LGVKKSVVFEMVKKEESSFAVDGRSGFNNAFKRIKLR
jgi:hypothetical protein